MLGKVFGWFTKSDSAISKVLDAGIAGLDKIKLTEEEKLDYKKGLAELWIKYQETLQGESTIRSITRRCIALGTIISFIVLCLLCALIFPVNKEWSAFLFEFLQESGLSGISLAVYVFYFGPTHIAPVLEKFQRKG